MSDIEHAIQLLVEHSDPPTGIDAPPTDDDLWRDSQLPGYPVSADTMLSILRVGRGRIPQLKRGPGNPDFVKRPYDILDVIEEDARWLWRGPCRGKLKLYDCRLAAATHWLRHYTHEDEDGAYDLVEKIIARSNQ